MQVGAWDEEGARAGWVPYSRADCLGWDFGKAPAAAESPLVSIKCPNKINHNINES